MEVLMNTNINLKKITAIVITSLILMINHQTVFAHGAEKHKHHHSKQIKKHHHKHKHYKKQARHNKHKHRHHKHVYSYKPYKPYYRPYPIRDWIYHGLQLEYHDDHFGFIYRH